MVVITEQTLEGNYFVVHNKRSGQSGKVPVDYIEISQSLSHSDTHTLTHSLTPSLP